HIDKLLNFFHAVLLGHARFSPLDLPYATASHRVVDIDTDDYPLSLRVSSWNSRCQAASSVKF
ncbi:MAG: hypothetical protein PWP34_1219, partial [Desulfuromonadales bacterium]|nr:hypothetical protein [Desulfuromonadales bacterium]